MTGSGQPTPFVAAEEDVDRQGPSYRQWRASAIRRRQSEAGDIAGDG